MVVKMFFFCTDTPTTEIYTLSLHDALPIFPGALVGSSGAILSYIRCKGMNRSFISVILGGFGGETVGAAGGAGEARPAQTGAAEDGGLTMKKAEKEYIVPGYGVAGAHAQHSLREKGVLLHGEGVGG